MRHKTASLLIYLLRNTRIIATVRWAFFVLICIRHPVYFILFLHSSFFIHFLSPVIYHWAVHLPVWIHKRYSSVVLVKSLSSFQFVGLFKFVFLLLLACFRFTESLLRVPFKEIYFQKLFNFLCSSLAFRNYISL